MGYIAALFTWSRYSHAALVSVEDGTVYCLEVREFRGGRKIELEKYLKEEPSAVEVWRLEEMPYQNFGSHAVAIRYNCRNQRHCFLNIRCGRDARAPGKISKKFLAKIRKGSGRNRRKSV